jgi:hypothetical protein
VGLFDIGFVLDLRGAHNHEQLVLAMTVLAVAGVFTTSHIAATAAVTGGLSFVGALLILGRRTGHVESLAIGLLAAAAVFLWRKSANMPQLNTDGLNGFSANDWLAPTITFVVLALYGALRQPPNLRRFARACALAVLVAFFVNVITI